MSMYQVNVFLKLFLLPRFLHLHINLKLLFQLCSCSQVKVFLKLS